MGFAGYVSVCVQGLTQGNNKNNERNELRKYTNGNAQSVTTWKRRQKSSKAESFRHMKIKIPYTLEDGHVGRNMR
jgi:hypothetical protein